MACDSYTRPALRLALARVLSHLVRHAAEVHLNWRASSKSRTPLRKRTTAGKRAAHGLSHDSALQGHLPPRQGCWVQFLRASKTSLGSHGDWERVVGDSFARDGCIWMRYQLSHKRRTTERVHESISSQRCDLNNFPSRMSVIKINP